MTQDQSPGVITYSDVREVLDRSELADVVIYELQASRIGEAVEPQYSMQVLTRLDGVEFEIRCKVEAQGQGGQYVAEAGGIFTLESEGLIEEGTRREFAEKVGVMTVYPYLRSSVSQLAASLGLDRPVLPLLRAGGVSLTQKTEPTEE